MAVLHKEFIEFNGRIKLTSTRKEDLKSSRKALRKTIKKWFGENKPDELPPKFWGQGSFEMNTTINPIPELDQEGNIIRKYDLDYGIYFIEREGEDNRRSIPILHDWVFEAVQNHTQKDVIRKTTCIRVVFSDGHHIDLPIYYKSGDIPELAHRSKGWIESDPKAFTEWFQKKGGSNHDQLCRIVRYLKAWKNFQESQYSNLKLPSGFELTILATENYRPKDNDDAAFGTCVEKMYTNLRQPLPFTCVRPTPPVGENLFAEYSGTKKDNFLNCLLKLVEACRHADEESNFLKASEHLITQFGDRFPKGADYDEKAKSIEINGLMTNSGLIHRPYHG